MASIRIKDKGRLVLPKWAEKLPGHANIGARDFALALGLHRGSLSNCIQDGTIPRPDFYIDRVSSPRKAMYWHVSTVKKFFDSHNAELQAAHSDGDAQR